MNPSGSRLDVITAFPGSLRPPTAGFMTIFVFDTATRTELSHFTVR